MMNRRRWVWLAVAVAVILAACLWLNPRIRTNLFVHLYHGWIEEGLALNNGVPADDVVLFGYRSVNTWEGEHSMVEFMISASGFGSETTYYGCYYSPDDVPLAFQNLDTELIRCEDDNWKWYGEGDNWGMTSKIMDHWYYFEASF